MKSVYSNQRGIALIVVILMISVIVVLTIQLNRASRAELYDAANLSDGIRLRYVAKSGFNAVQALLLNHKPNFDTLTQEWAKTDELSKSFENAFDFGRVRVFTEDESGKIPVNRLLTGGAVNPVVREMMINLLSLPEYRLEEERVQIIVDSLKDWLDSDSEVTGKGAESEYYKSLDKPYSAKNASIESMEELLMIKGFSNDLYRGTADTPGLEKHISLSGDGKININTCPKLILRVLSKEITPELADAIDAYRRNPENEASLSDPMWYKKIRGMANISINPALITTRSDYFRITSTGYFQNMTETVSGVIKRDQAGKAATLLTWREY